MILYAHDRAEPEKGRVAHEILGSDQENLVVSTQVLLEFYWTATRNLRTPLPHRYAFEVVDQLCDLTVIGADGELVRSAFALAEQFQIASWDAMIVRAAQVGGCSRLLTEDLNAGQRFGDVVVENPFA